MSENNAQRKPSSMWVCADTSRPAAADVTEGVSDVKGVWQTRHRHACSQMFKSRSESEEQTFNLRADGAAVAFMTLSIFGFISLKRDVSLGSQYAASA